MSESWVLRQTFKSKSKAADSELVVLERVFELVLGHKTPVLVLDGIVVAPETEDVDEVDPSLDAPV